MMRRLMLGCGALGGEVLQTVTTWPGELQVIANDENRVESLREQGLVATAGDPTKPSNVPNDDVDVVIVADSDPEVNRAAATVARQQYPDALLVAYTGGDPQQGDGATAQAAHGELRELADRTIDPTTALAERVSTAATGDATNVHRLLRVLRETSGPLAVLAHDNPDPDAIASAVGLCHIARRVGVTATPCYFGEISHQENRALVNLLELELHDLSDESDLEEYEAIALVDHSRPGVNDQLDPETEIDIVVDHHPPRGPVEARFVDLRADVGATSTLISDYFDRLGETPESNVAGALLYGIRIDTKEFTREVSTADFEAAASLIDHVDIEALQKVESPSVSADVLTLIGTAIRNRSVRGATLTSCVGRVSDRDALAQAAERLLDMEGIETTLVYGFMDGTVYVSGRARGSEIDLGETLREAFDQIGSAGGHADMAGAQIPLGILGDSDDVDDESLSKIVCEVIDNRFIEALEDVTSPVEGTGFTYEHGPRRMSTDQRAAVQIDSESRSRIDRVGRSASGEGTDEASTEEDAPTEDASTEDVSAIDDTSGINERD